MPNLSKINWFSQAAIILTSLTLLVGSVFSGAAEAAERTIPPVPAYSELPLPDNQSVMGLPTGELSWLGSRSVDPAPKNSPYGRWYWELVIARWNPASGRITQTPLEPGISGFVYSQLALPSGLLAVTPSRTQAGEERWRFLFIPNDGSPAITQETNEAIDLFQTGLLKLGNDAAALVTRTKVLRHIKVFIVQRVKNKLEITAMPVLPIAYRSDFASAVAGKDQVMILGGSDGNYRGCSPCRAETHVLDLKTKTWSDGPPMLEARSELAASTLPDGSVLVTGGWTKAADWGSGASRTAERWNPATNQFEALPPMPTGTARHKHIWWDAPWGRTLLVVQGIAGAAHSLDISNWSWRTVAEWYQGSEEGGCGFYPFVAGGNAYAWLVNRAEGFYSSKSCLEQKYASLSLLRPPMGALPSSEVPPEGLLISYRNGSAFLPAMGEAPALVIGGSRHGGRNAYVISSAVESIGRDGRIATLPSLLTARKYARAFRAAGGVLVVGGSGPDSPYGGERHPKPLKAEWLAPAGSTPWQWQEISGTGPSASAAVTQLRDGSLLVLDHSGDLRQLKLVSHNGKPTFESIAWPSLNRERRHGSDDGEAMRIQELEDGRILVAGGTVRSERIALYSPQALKPGQPDDYVGIGDFLPWRRYEIFDPARRRWINSAPAGAAGGRAIILSNGSVIKVSSAQKGAEGLGQQRFVLEASTPAGTAWGPLTSAGSRLKIDNKFSLFTIEDELFANGEVDELSTGGGPSGVEWLNPATGTWELLWQAVQKDNWRGHQGRILRRTLVGADGKSKTVLIPVGGL
jgi:hypothetical protein